MIAWTLALVVATAIRPQEPAPAPAPASPTAPARAPRTAPVVYDERGGLFLDARVKGGADPVRFVLDTGASRSALDETFARRIGLVLRDGGDVEGTAGKVKARAANVDVDV